MGNTLTITLLQVCSVLNFASAGGGLPIFVRNADGNHQAVEVPGEGNVADLYAAVAAKVGHPSFALSIAGSTLMPTTSLADSGISAESVVQIQEGDLSGLNQFLTTEKELSFRQRVIDELSQFPGKLAMVQVVHNSLAGSYTERWLLQKDDDEIYTGIGLFAGISPFHFAALAGVHVENYVRIEI